MNRKLALMLIFTLLGGAQTTLSQEPAFLGGAMAVRYEEAKGDFHYVIPCKQPALESPRADTSGAPAPMLPALCWPVLAGSVSIVDGKAKGAVPVAGIFMVSALLLRFLPDDPKTPSPMADEKPSEIAFRYDPTQIVAVLSTKSANYMFAFRAFCLGCTPGISPIDLHKSAQLEAEYREFGESLTQFPRVSERINGLAAKMRIGVTPLNQPNQNNSPEAMALYSDLNRKLEAPCPESARVCLQNYATYQACHSGSPRSDCGEPPSCSAYCALSVDVVRDLKATWCYSRTVDSATLIPDWSDFFRLEDAAREAKGPQGVKFVQEAVAPTTSPSDNACSVEAGFKTAMFSHSSGTAGIVSGTPGGTFPGTGSSGTPIMRAAPPQKLSISSGVMAQNLLVKTAPAYPAVAKAAHVEGTVVLACTISKSGSMSNLQVISGPPLLQQAALDAVKTWEYKPYLLNGDPVEVHTTVNVVFSLGGTAPAPTPAQQ